MSGSAPLARRSHEVMEDRPDLETKLSEDVLEKATTPMDEPVEAKHLVEFTDEEEKRLLRKMDWNILPLMVVTWGLAYYDKVMMGQAVLFGMRQDLKLVNPGSRYSNASMIFFIGYIVGLAPLGYLTQRVSTRKSCFVIVLIWGILALCTAALKSYAGIMVLRFLLGFFEAGIGPSFITMTGLYYTKQEQALRAPIWVASAPLTNIFTPMLNYGLGSIKSHLKGWRIMYLFAGSFTVVWSFIVLWRMPDGIQEAKFLDERQKEIAVERIRRGNGGMQNKKIKPAQIWEAFGDYHVWGLAVLAFCSYFPNGVLTTFSSLLIRDLGYTTVENLAVQIPKGVVGVAANLIVGWFNRKYLGWRFHSYTFCIGLALAGSIALLLAPRVPGLLGALYGLHFFGSAAGQVYAMSSSNISGSSKRTAAAISLSVGTAAAQAAAPLLFDTDQAPKYTRGFIATITITATGMVISELLRFALMLRNRSRDKAGHVGTEHGLEDITDLENKDFRYAL